ncbi:hypothetical protein AAP_05440 [Ascosphaera apis ARSEF 7405]|uniref:Tubby n=1 Tax=Ascosphaera apis ARSEF 7405 TaxID=392613 RepID=A0A167VMA7_9EURO|nr:hypothetical protein AAP_05440 [Ascosphaera apis ARSEF 7405]
MERSSSQSKMTQPLDHEEAKAPSYVREPPSYSKWPRQGHETADPSELPIGIHKKYAFRTPRRLVIRHSNHLRTDFDVFVQSEGTDPSSLPDQNPENFTKIIDGIGPYFRVLSSINRLWRDSKTNQPLFRVNRRFWQNLYEVSAVNKQGDPVHEITSIDTNYFRTGGYLLDRFQMCLNGGDGMREYAKIEAKGDSYNKTRLEVFCDGRKIMKINRTDSWAYLLCMKRLTWVVDLEAGVDASLAAIIVGLSSDIL